MNELLLTNGTIYTVDETFSRASALAVKNNVIVYAGNDKKEAASRLSPGARHLDLKGLTVVPGLIDSHLHLLTQGRRLSEIDIFHKSKESILRLIALEAERLEPGTWILGRGWNHEVWQRNVWPAKEELDAVAPRNPVALTRSDAHSVWVNSLALRAAGFHRNSETPPGGEILRTPDGDLLGILVDTPIFKIWEAMPSLTEEQTLKAYRLAETELLNLGITSVGDAWETVQDHEMLKKAHASGMLRLRVYGMLASVDRRQGHYFREDFRPVRGLFGERLSLAAFKVVLDGSLGSRSAWLTHDYADRPGHRGSSRFTDDELCELIAPAVKNGFQVCIHAIGDAAVLQALRALERMQDIQGGADRRHRIEHFQIASPKEVRRAVKLGVIPAMQTIHAAADKQMAESRLGLEALGNSYPWRQIIDNGGIFANGSDSPMEVVNPFKGFYAAVTRTGFPSLQDGHCPRLCLSREEALKSYTIWAAQAEFGERRKGSLECGKLADFAVLDRDIMTCAAEDIPDTQVRLTVLDGQIAYQARDFPA